jgi:ABC-type uncharacterized transport system YnjBCD substrate-binding protein
MTTTTNGVRRVKRSRTTSDQDTQAIDPEAPGREEGQVVIVRIAGIEQLATLIKTGALGAAFIELETGYQRWIPDTWWTQAT